MMYIILKIIIYHIGSLILKYRDLFNSKFELNDFFWDNSWYRSPIDSPSESLIDLPLNYKNSFDFGQIDKVDCGMSNLMTTNVHKEKGNMEKKEDKMNDVGLDTNVLVKINKKGETPHEFKGKLVGFIEDDQCKALINTENAAEYIYKNATPIDLKDRPTALYNRRMVIITEELDDKKVRLFISAKIRSSGPQIGINFNKKLSIECKDDKKFELTATG